MALPTRIRGSIHLSRDFMGEFGSRGLPVRIYRLGGLQQFSFALAQKQWRGSFTNSRAQSESPA